MTELTPGLLKADDVHAAHGRHLHHFANSIVHGIDLWRIYTLNQSHVACLHVGEGLSPYLVQDGGVSWQDDVVLNESHTDPSGRPQLLLRRFKPVRLQLKVTLGRRVHSACWNVQLPVPEKLQVLNPKQKDGIHISQRCEHLWALD